MIFFLGILVFIIFNGMQFSRADEFNASYLDRKSTASVNGIFVIMVIFSHYSQYADFGGMYDEAYLIMKEHLNQMVVATFWFYSGYGMMEALKKTQGGYVSKIPAKFWQLLFRFDIAVILFWILNIMIGREYPAKKIALSFIAWDTIGNSNWYIFAVLAEYILMWISFRISLKVSKEKYLELGTSIFLLLTVCLVYTLMAVGRPGYTYNTIVLLPLGMIYSESRGALEKWIQKNDVSYLTTLTIIIAVYIVSYFRRWKYGIEGYTIWAVAFICIVILITMKLSVSNAVLEWFGRHVFSIYILQRIPMTILSKTGSIESHKYMSLIVTIVATMLFAAIFEKYTNQVIGYIECTILKHEVRDTISNEERQLC